MNSKNIYKYVFYTLIVLFSACGQEFAEPKLNDVTELSPSLPQSIKLVQNPIRVLSIDGGGIRGVIPAHLLADIEKKTQKKIHELFDVVVGTSTGGLIALLLTIPQEGGVGPLMTAQQVREFYVAEGKDIFKRKFSSLRGVNGPKYEVTSFENIIRRLVGTKLFKNTLKPVGITAFDIEKRQGFLFESDVETSLTIEEVARATSAAPTYFPPKVIHLPDGVHYFVDGGLYKNNPAVLAYEKAVKNFGLDEVNRRGIFLVSIGTGAALARGVEGEKLIDAGFKTWIPELLDSFLHSMTDHSYLENHFSFLARTKSLPNETHIPFWRYARLQVTLNNTEDKTIMARDNTSEKNISNLIHVAEGFIEQSNRYQETIKLLQVN